LEGVSGGDTVNKFDGRLAVQQRVLPFYRKSFIDMLADSCNGGLSVFSGKPLSIEGIDVANAFSSAYLSSGKNFHILDPSSRYYFCWQRGLIPWLESWDPDALIVEANPRYLSTRLAVRWMKQRERPVLGWGLGVPRRGYPIERFLRRSFLFSLNGVISYSQRGAEEYRASGVRYVTVAHNSVSKRPKKKPLPRPIEKVNKPVVLFVGRLQARKRLEILLKACRDLPNDLQPNLVIVGDGPAREVFEEIAKKVYPKAIFVGAVHGEELNPFFERADLFALPGTGGLAVQHAMAHGLPVIVAEGDGTQDDLVRPENGWQVPPGDQGVFTTVLQEALSDLSRLRKMGTESYRIVTEEINLEAMVAAFIDALREVRQT
jgi:glycosyltransferase involved in cell wall biosynthesis